MRKLSVGLLAIALAAGSAGNATFGCDDAKIVKRTIISVSTESFSESSELLSRLEQLLEPVAKKVVTCNEELHAAEQKARSIEIELTAAEAIQNKNVKGMSLLKNALTERSCHVCIGNQLYSRETVGRVLEGKLADYKTQATTIEKLAMNLASQRKTVKEVAAKVARWIEKEKELVGQVEQLEKVQGLAIKQSTEDATKLAESVEKMLDANTNSIPNAQLLAEVDSVLKSNAK